MVRHSELVIPFYRPSETGHLLGNGGTSGSFGVARLAFTSHATVGINPSPSKLDCQHSNSETAFSITWGVAKAKDGG